MRTNTLITLLVLSLGVQTALAQTVPAHAENLQEALVSVTLKEGAQQSGVFSVRTGVTAPTHLAVLLPGSPSVVRPVVENNVMVRSKLTGNFLIRARRQLVNDSIATLIVDCRSDSGDECASRYQASRERQQDVQMLIDEVTRLHPSIQQVWLIGTSLGTISSSYMPTYLSTHLAMTAPAKYTGVIHTATITEGRSGSAELVNFNYGKTTVPQFFVHHRADPCRITPYENVKNIAARYQLPLVTVEGGSGFSGAPCQAATEHGFKGREAETMKAIAGIVMSGRAEQLELR